uniref:Zinc knuckle CX2CX4HX4C domain-containing protein n=1 Tax=Cannabis sativa TaxID=3483 RepID=A0A803QD30_CANSA
MLFEGEDQLSNMWISFKYERLNTFCKFCGPLDHIHTECVALLEEIEAGTRPILQCDDKIKTTDLDHMFSPVRSSTTGGPIHKSVTQMAKDVALKKARSAVLGLTTKRLKILISDQEQVTTYTHKTISNEEVSLLNQKPIGSNKSDSTNISFIKNGNAGEKTKSSELSMGKTIEVEANSGSKVKTKNSKA